MPSTPRRGPARCSDLALLIVYGPFTYVRRECHTDLSWFFVSGVRACTSSETRKSDQAVSGVRAFTGTTQWRVSGVCACMGGGSYSAFVGARRDRAAVIAAVEDLSSAIGDLGLRVESGQGPLSAASPDLIVEVGAANVPLVVVALAAPTPTTAAGVIGSTRVKRGQIPVLVGDRLSEGVRSLLRDANWGWLDRRGHIRLWGGGLFVDASFAADPGALAHAHARSRDVLSSEVGIAVALELLIRPEHVPTGRPLAARIGRSPSATAQALADLRERSLIRASGSPLVPELFWELAAHWRPSTVAVANLPDPRDLEYGGALAYDPDHTTAVPVVAADATAALAAPVPPLDPGWAVGDTVAAQSWGAPVVAARNYPPDFFVPSERLLRLAVAKLGTAPSPDRRAATIAVAPAPGVCRYRYSSTPHRRGALKYPVVHPVVVALDLARDPSRGREILDGWTPPEGITRVW